MPPERPPQDFADRDAAEFGVLDTSVDTVEFPDGFDWSVSREVGVAKIVVSGDPIVVRNATKPEISTFETHRTDWLARNAAAQGKEELDDLRNRKIFKSLIREFRRDLMRVKDGQNPRTVQQIMRATIDGITPND